MSEATAFRPRVDPLDPLERVSRREGLMGLGAQLAALRDWLAGDLDALEAGIDALVATIDAHLAEQAAAHLLARPGKRVRPICVFLAARLGHGAPSEQLHSAALAAELVHAATLLHDDVIDEGRLRRGAPTARVVYGNSASVLAGDHLLVTALQRLEPCPADLRRELLGVISEMVAAEALQLERRGTTRADPAFYLRVVEGKTAALFRWSLSAGATLGGLSAPVARAMGQVGRLLGVAFQLADDVLDLIGDPAATGKELLADLREGKLTWPLLLAHEADPALASVLARGPEQAAEQAAWIVGRVRDSGAIEATRAFARQQIDAALELLDQRAPPGPARRALAWVIESAIARRS